MPESFRTRIERIGFNLYPCYRGTGSKILYISNDWQEVRLKLPLAIRTRNYRGSIFGGSMYGAVDPIYMIMLIKNLGPGFNIWDKAAKIRFRKPGNKTLYANFRIDDNEINEIIRMLETEGSIDREYAVNLIDKSGTVYATVEKTIYVARRKDVQYHG